MISYGLIGKKLSHSFSAKFFNEKFKQEGIPVCYKLFELDSLEELPKLLKNHPEIQGLNVTIPYKSAILKYLNRYDDKVYQTNACNTIVINKGELIGYNTDIEGFKATLKPFLPSVTKGALILGKGGASAAVAYVLKQHSIPYFTVGRNNSFDILTYDNLQEKHIRASSLIIQTTPLGMFPDMESYPNIPYEALNTQHSCIDLVYNPEKTRFLQLCESQGVSNLSNGLSMLFAQAESAWELWSKHLG
jgi:shikimate dehydrogenase